MKLVTFVRMGKISFGALKAGGVVDLTGRIDHNVNSIKDILKLDLIENAKEYIQGQKSRNFYFRNNFFCQ